MDDRNDKRGIVRVLVPSLIVILACVVCLCGASWAWFTATASVGVEPIRTAEHWETQDQTGDSDTVVSEQDVDDVAIESDDEIIGDEDHTWSPDNSLETGSVDPKPEDSGDEADVATDDDEIESVDVLNQSQES